MKTNILRLLLLFSVFAMTITFAQAQDAMEDAVGEPAPIMTFEKKFIDLGEVKKGEKRQTVFKFKNTGNAPLEIDLISACDCTTTDYPRLPVMPGESGEIDVIFDSSEKDESETIDIDIFLKSTDPESGAPIIEMLQYKYELIE